MMNSFGISIIPSNETARIATLKSYHILDSQEDLFFDNLAQIMARCFSVPIALVSLVDEERVFFKANAGMPDVNNVSRGVSLCSLAILEPQPLVFENALLEPCLLANPMVAGEFGLRFYAGAPITTPDGYNIGTVCIVDKKPRAFEQMDKVLLSRFAESAMKGIAKHKEALQNNGCS